MPFVIILLRTWYLTMTYSCNKTLKINLFPILNWQRKEGHTMWLQNAYFQSILRTLIEQIHYPGFLLSRQCRKLYITYYRNRSWNQPVLNNECKVSCSMQQRLVEPMRHRLLVVINSTTPTHSLKRSVYKINLGLRLYTLCIWQYLRLVKLLFKIKLTIFVFHSRYFHLDLSWI